MAPEKRLTHLFISTLLCILFFSLQAQDSITVQVYDLSKVSIFNTLSASQRSLVMQFKVGESEWKPVGANGKYIKPYLANNPISKKYWKRFKFHTVSNRVTSITEKVGFLFIASWLINEIDDGSGKKSHLYTGLGLSFGGDILSGLFFKKAKKNLFRSIDRYNNTVLKK